MHPLLRQNDQGQIEIDWRRLIRGVVAVSVVWLATTLVFDYFLGRSFNVGSAISFCAIMVVTMALLLYFVKRRAEGKSLRQFSLAALMVVITVACLVLGTAAWQAQSQSAAFAKRQQLCQQLEITIQKIVGKGIVHARNPMLVQVKRPSFNNDDLAKILLLQPQFEEAGSPLGYLDLTGTSVTDAGVIELKEIESLEYLFLDQTIVSDESLDAIKSLPMLKLISVNTTRVTPEAILDLSKSRPKLILQPRPKVPPNNPPR